MTAKTKRLDPGHRVSVRNPKPGQSKWIQDTSIDLAPGDTLAVTTVAAPPPDPVPPPTDLPEPTHIISPTGSDNAGTGSLANPWATVGKFLSLALAPGATLGCRGGAYPAVAGNRNHYVSNVAGTASRRITIRQYQDEKPIFRGGASGHFLALRGSSDYWTLTGLELLDYIQKSFGVLNLGHDFGGAFTKGPDGTIISKMVVRFPASSSLAGNTEHAIYVNRMTKNTLLEDDFFEGCTAMQAGGAGVHIYPDSITNTVIRRLRARRWDHGVQMAGSTVAGTVIEWSTFWDNLSQHIDVYDHGSLAIRNNVGEAGTPFLTEHSGGSVTQDHNYPNETLNADGSLQAGSAAIGGAHDGSDAGAIPFS